MLKKMRPMDWFAQPLYFFGALAIYLFVLGGPFGLGQMLVIAVTVAVLYPASQWLVAKIREKRRSPQPNH